MRWGWVAWELYKKIVTPLLLLWLALAFQGCFLPGNGEPVGGPSFNGTGGPSAGAGSGAASPTIYYDIDPNSVCTGASGTKVYQWSITPNASGAFLTNNCSGTSTAISTDVLQYSLDRKLIGYEVGNL